MLEEMCFFTGGSFIMDFGQKYDLKLKCCDGFISYKHTAFHNVLIDGHLLI